MEKDRKAAASNAAKVPGVSPAIGFSPMAYHFQSHMYSFSFLFLMSHKSIG